MPDSLRNAELLQALRKYNACSDALAWVGDRDAATAWKTCPRGDWLLWITARVGVERKQIVLAACSCARLALKYVGKGEARPRRCIEVTEAWAHGKATIDEVRAAARASWSAAADADSAAAAYAAAAAATYAYADAYAADAAAAARVKMQDRTAKAVRKHITLRDVLNAMKRKLETR